MRPGERADAGIIGRRLVAMSSNHAEILRVLRSAKSPMTAYAILGAVQNTRITAPMTVYRGLSRLIADGAVHRLESLNAYVACSGLPHLHGSSVFAICRDCGHVDELAEVDVVQRLHSNARRLGFQVEATTIELTGRCALCAQSQKTK
jgi:Fur family transcriptional regulator, zinc uptake regulator